MSVSLRLGKEYLAQSLIFAVTMAERVILAAVLVRVWGSDGFAVWSIASAAAGLVVFFDFGVNLYYGNRLAFALEQVHQDEARHALRAGNLLMSMASVVALIAVSLGFMAYLYRSGGLDLDLSVWGVAVLLALGSAARMAMAVHFNLYRGHREYARHTTILAIADFVRLVAMAAAALLGAGLASVALLSTLALVGGSVVWILLDTRRYAGFGFGLEWPRRSEWREIFSTSTGYWIQSAPTTLLTFLPVFLLAATAASAAVVAGFVLVRTLANFTRTTIQQFAMVLGLEASRRTASGDAAGVATVYLEGARMLGAQAAAGAGLLIATGRPLFEQWTGETNLYDPPLLVAAMAPLIFLPTLILANMYFNSVNRPWPVAIGRTWQLAMTVLLYFLLPVPSDAVRMMAAISIGEVLGFGVPVTVALSRMVPGTGFVATFNIAMTSLAPGAVSYASARAVLLGVDAPEPLPLLAALAAGGLAGAIAVLLFGFRPERRKALAAPLRAWWKRRSLN